MRRALCCALLAAAFAQATAQPIPEPSRVPAEVMGDRPTTRPADEVPANREPNPTSVRPEPPNSTSRRLPEAATRADAPLEEGRTSFSEAQARSRMEQAGFSQVGDLRLEENGIWRAMARREGRLHRIGLDYRGTVRAD